MKEQERAALLELSRLLIQVAGRKAENDVREILTPLGILDTEWLPKPEPTSLELFNAARAADDTVGAHWARAHGER